jgi:hypothetical protein
MSKKPILQIVTHHCQNPLDFICIEYLIKCLNFKDNANVPKSMAKKVAQISICIQLHKNF